MKGWTESSMREKGLRFTVTGGAPVAAAPVAEKKPGRKKEPLLASRRRAALDEIVLDLDTPPSVNTCWVNVAGVGRVRSPAYRRWHKVASAEAALTQGRIEGEYTALIELGQLAASADVDNRTKPTLDMLAGLMTDDDRACVDARAKWSADVKPRRMRVTLRRAA